MIAQASASYPVLGAADAAGLPHGVGRAMVGAWRAFQVSGAHDDWRPYALIFAEAEKAHGYDAVTVFFAAIRDAQRDGRLG